MKEEQTYTVSNRHSLVDLNKDHTNFKLRFECISNSVFEMCITNQEELDQIDISQLQMKTVDTGTISGNIVADSNIYQNYFLVLRAEKETMVNVIIELEEIEPNLQTPPQLENDDVVSRKINIPMIMIGLLILIIMSCFIYFLFFVKTNHTLPPPSLVDEIIDMSL